MLFFRIIILSVLNDYPRQDVSILSGDYRNKLPYLVYCSEKYRLKNRFFQEKDQELVFLIFDQNSTYIFFCI